MLQVAKVALVRLQKVPHQMKTASNGESGEVVGGVCLLCPLASSGAMVMVFCWRWWVMRKMCQLLMRYEVEGGADIVLMQMMMRMIMRKKRQMVPEVDEGYGVEAKEGRLLMMMMLLMMATERVDPPRKLLLSSTQSSAQWRRATTTTRS